MTSDVREKHATKQDIEAHRIMMIHKVGLALSQRRLLSKSRTPDAVFVKVGKAFVEVSTMVL